MGPRHPFAFTCRGRAGLLLFGLQIPAFGLLAASDLLCVTDIGQVWLAPMEVDGAFGPSAAIAATTLRHDASSNLQIVAGRFGGDARHDLAGVTFGGELLLSLRSGDGFAAPQAQGGGFDFDVLNGALVLAGDVDGDGDDDLLQLRSNGDVELARNDAGAFAPLQTVLAAQVFFDFSANQWAGVGDHDGDGRDDLLAVSGPLGDITWWRSTGAGFAPPVALGPSGFRMDVTAGWGLHLADVNGDGRDDLVCLTEFGEAWAMESSGLGWSSHSKWGAPGFHDAPLVGRGWTVYAADTNADSRADLICLTEFGEAWISESTGTAFAPPTRRGAPGFQNHPAGPFVTFAGAWE